MEVWVNDQKIEIFTGARVKNALLKYSKHEYQAVLSGEKIMVDKNINPLDLEGELTESSRIYIKKI